MRSARLRRDVSRRGAPLLAALALGLAAPCAAQGFAQDFIPPEVRAALGKSLPPEAAAAALSSIGKAPDEFRRLLAAAREDGRSDPMLLYLVDKTRALPEGYAPADLVGLDGTGLTISRPGHRLRKPAFLALKAMDAAARAEGVTLEVSSSYRSYQYQVEVWNRTLARDGEAVTEASVARPGHSQHQLGTAVDFGSITDEFALTSASRWLEANARRFGFTLSFPKGLTAVTGYEWESWHYRYIGKAAAALEGEFFDGVQERLLAFLDTLTS